ncbi:MAG: phosphorylase [Bacteroidetes bacterium]|jgi:uridine phosphorylase|nr:phosphorylase [Bacteroidota bacterium]
MDGSELILNERGALYHIDLKPGEIADTIITVGDPKRVEMLETRLDHIHLHRSHREFAAVTGECAGKNISIISTGIGTDNIDIVLSEIDAVFNIDLKVKRTRSEIKPITFIRLGTSGSLQADISVGDIVLSKYAVGLDSLLGFYSDTNTIRIPDLEEKVKNKTDLNSYACASDPFLLSHFSALGISGITITCPGFYGPQGRRLRMVPENSTFLKDISEIEHKKTLTTNFEMETSGIYGLAGLMGHRALSISCILANRMRGEFSSNPKHEVEKMIDRALAKIVEL